MTNHIDNRTIEAGMRQGRIERAIAFRRMGSALSRGLRATVKFVAAMFA